MPGPAPQATAARDAAPVSDRRPSDIETRQPYQVDDLFRIEYPVDPRIAPDGEHVVFVREFTDLVDDRWHGQLWSVAVRDGEMRQLTDGHHYDSSPRISPDGRQVAFFSDRSGSLQIYVKPLAAGKDEPARRLSQLGDSEDPWGLAWSPDGKTLSFVARQLVDPPFAGLLSPPPDGAEWAEPPRVIDRLVYRRDGRGYLDDGCERIYLISVDGGPARRATKAEECLDEATIDLVNHERDGEAPVWTPDGRSLLTAANRRTETARRSRPLDLDLYEVDIETGDIRPLVQSDGLENLPAVSPDGTKIAFLGFVDRGMSYQVAELFVAKRDGSGVRSLTAELDRDVDCPRWSGDGGSIYFTFHDHGTTRIGRVELDGELTVVADGVSDGYSAYDGGAFTLSADGRVAFTHSTTSQAGEVAVADSRPESAPPIRRLTRLNDALVASRRLAAVDDIEFESADGITLQGWIVRPPTAGVEPSPMVLDIHGGPFLNWGRRFDIEKQILASQGFSVLYINPRGSSGYGEDFANLIHQDYPGGDVGDLLAAVDLLVDRGEADPERLFVTGGSGGALLTFALLAETQRFRAAVAIYPLVNWTSFVLTSDYAPVALTRWLPGSPWEHPQHYLEWSPLWDVDRMNTPTLVVAGEEDYRTPVSEAEQIFAALQIRGVESVLVRLPETPHFAERRPSHYRARIAYGLHWFQRHLDPSRDGDPEPAGVPAPPDPK